MYMCACVHYLYATQAKTQLTTKNICSFIMNAKHNKKKKNAAKFVAISSSAYTHSHTRTHRHIHIHI